MQLQVLYLPSEQLALVDVVMPTLSSDRTYQAWQITPGGPVSMGLLSERGALAVRGDMREVSAVAISIEPEGGSSSPSSEPVLIASF